MIDFFGGRTKIIFFAAAALVVLILPAAHLFNRLSFSDSEVCWNWGSNQASTFPKEKLVQSFIPEKDGLRTIVMKPLLRNDSFDPAETEFTIRDGANKILFFRKVRHFWMENAKMFELSVPADKFRRGGQYFLEITPFAGVEKKPKRGLGFWVTNGDCYPGELSVDEKKKEVDLAATFRYSDGSLSENTQTLLERMVQFKPLWLKSGPVLPILFLSFLSAAFFWLVLLAGKIRKD